MIRIIELLKDSYVFEVSNGPPNPVALDCAEQLAELLELQEDLVQAWRWRRQLLEWSLEFQLRRMKNDEK